MRNSLIGTICGDVLGSIFERVNEKSIDIELFNDNSSFTDDTILTVAIADAILNDVSYESKIIEYGKKYPKRGYGGSFKKWLDTDPKEPYDSWGNGSAMRVSPVAFAFESMSEF
jgi:ADP-ribosylglycohydrolase